MEKEKLQEGKRENRRWYGASSAPSANYWPSRTAPTAQETSARNTAAATTAKNYEPENTQSQAKKERRESTQYLGNSSTRRPSSTVNHTSLRPSILHPKIAKPHLLSHNHNGIF